jgi:phosphohistidine phosphatase
VTLRLYFLRHGKAWARVDWHDDDDLRPLTAAGEALVRSEGRAMKAMGLAPDVIVTSPLARARRTAEIVAREAPAASLMVVGHEPDFSATVAELTGGGRVDFKKGGLARVDVRGPQLDDGTLAWLLTPALITGE